MAITPFKVIQRHRWTRTSLQQTWQQRVSIGWLEFAGVENDGVEQEQTYILHQMKNFNVYDM